MAQPLVEESENYHVGYGPTSAPLASWSASNPALSLSPSQVAELRSVKDGEAFWVQQLGSFAASRPSYLGTLA